jgi:hypothetical protein
MVVGNAHVSRLGFPQALVPDDNKMRFLMTNGVLLVENRRQSPKYLVDRESLEALVDKPEAIIATLESLADAAPRSFAQAFKDHG